MVTMSPNAENQENVLGAPGGDAMRDHREVEEQIQRGDDHDQDAEHEGAGADPGHERDVQVEQGQDQCEQEKRPISTVAMMITDRVFWVTLTIRKT